MNNKSKIIVLTSFVIIIIAIIIINNIDSNSIIENLENQKDSQNKESKDKKENEINIPKSSCISGCVISFDDCTYLNNGTSKCKWSNYFNYNNTNYDETYEQNCDSCPVISGISYENISTDDNKNIYHFKYKNKKITLKNGEYMDQEGKVKKLPKPKHLAPLTKNQKLSNADLDELTGGDDEITNSIESNTSSNTKTSPSTNLDNNINGKVSNDDIISALSTHIKSTFGNYLNSIVSNHMNNRNIGSNLNTSPHSNIQYTNLDSSLTNLANANSSNRIMNDNPYIQNVSCSNSQGQQMQCPKPYDYKPPLSN